LAFFGGFSGWRQLREFGLDGGKVRTERFLEQPHLLRREGLATGRKALALVQSQFVGQLVDVGLAVEQFLFLGTDLSDQILRQIAQLLGIEAVQAGQLHPGLAIQLW